MSGVAPPSVAVTPPEVRQARALVACRCQYESSPSTSGRCPVILSEHLLSTLSSNLSYTLLVLLQLYKRWHPKHKTLRHRKMVNESCLGVGRGRAWGVKTYPSFSQTIPTNPTNTLKRTSSTRLKRSPKNSVLPIFRLHAGRFGALSPAAYTSRHCLSLFANNSLQSPKCLPHALSPVISFHTTCPIKNVRVLFLTALAPPSDHILDTWSRQASSREATLEAASPTAEFLVSLP